MAGTGPGRKRDTRSRENDPSDGDRDRCDKVEEAENLSHRSELRAPNRSSNERAASPVSGTHQEPTKEADKGKEWENYTHSFEYRWEGQQCQIRGIRLRNARGVDSAMLAMLHPRSTITALGRSHRSRGSHSAFRAPLRCGAEVVTTVEALLAAYSGTSP